MTANEDMRQRLWDLRNYVVAFVALQDLAYHHALADEGFVNRAVLGNGKGPPIGCITILVVILVSIALHVFVQWCTTKGRALVADPGEEASGSKNGLAGCWTVVGRFQLAAIWASGLHLICTNGLLLLQNPRG